MSAFVIKLSNRKICFLSKCSRGATSAHCEPAGTILIDHDSRTLCSPLVKFNLYGKRIAQKKISGNKVLHAERTSLQILTEILRAISAALCSPDGSPEGLSLSEHREDHQPARLAAPFQLLQPGWIRQEAEICPQCSEFTSFLSNTEIERLSHACRQQVSCLASALRNQGRVRHEIASGHLDKSDSLVALEIHTNLCRMRTGQSSRKTCSSCFFDELARENSHF